LAALWLLLQHSAKQIQPTSSSSSSMRCVAAFMAARAAWLPECHPRSNAIVSMACLPVGVEGVMQVACIASAAAAPSPSLQASRSFFRERRGEKAGRQALTHHLLPGMHVPVFLHYIVYLYYFGMNIG